MNLALDRPRFFALAALLSAAALLWAGELSRDKRLSTRPQLKQVWQMPVAVGNWQGRSLAVGSRVVEILETDDVSLMEYRRSAGEPVWLAFVAGFGNRAAFHPPEICYVGSHYEVLERGPIQVVLDGKQQRFMRLVIGQDKKKYEAWYWFTANKRITPNYYQQQFWLLLDTIHSRHSSGTLVRISTPLDDAQSSHERLLDFAASWQLSF